MKEREAKDDAFLGFWLKLECSRPVAQPQSPHILFFLLKE